MAMISRRWNIAITLLFSGTNYKFFFLICASVASIMSTPLKHPLRFARLKAEAQFVCRCGLSPSCNNIVTQCSRTVCQFLLIKCIALSWSKKQAIPIIFSATNEMERLQCRRPLIIAASILFLKNAAWLAHSVSSIISSSLMQQFNVLALDFPVIFIRCPGISSPRHSVYTRVIILSKSEISNACLKKIVLRGLPFLTGGCR